MERIGLLEPRISVLENDFDEEALEAEAGNAEAAAVSCSALEWLQLYNLLLDLPFTLQDWAVVNHTSATVPKFHWTTLCAQTPQPLSGSWHLQLP